MTPRYNLLFCSVDILKRMALEGVVVCSAKLNDITVFLSFLSSLIGAMYDYHRVMIVTYIS